MDRFGLDDPQAQAILDMRLKALQGLDREKLEAEYGELERRISYYNELLGSSELLRSVLKEELVALRDKYGDVRKTDIEDVEDEIDIEDLIDEEACVYTLTHGGYIKRLPASEYRAQGRGGRGVRAMATREEDYVETVFTASTHDNILFFTNFGRVYIKKGYLIPEAGRNARGTNIVNILQIDPGEKVSAMICCCGFGEDRYFVMVTKNGTVKRLEQAGLKNIRVSGIRALRLDDGDELISVRETDGSRNILIATHDGVAICFDENDVRPMGREATGVRGIRLRPGDYVVGAATAESCCDLLSVTENGYGKRTAVEQYLRGSDGTPQRRGGMGVKNYNCTGKTGKVADVRLVSAEDDILVISDDGTIIRMAADSISLLGRATQGVRIMRLAEGAKVISVAKTDREDDGDTEPSGDEDAEAAGGPLESDAAEEPENPEE
jgi:DNA gyrase subunit A